MLTEPAELALAQRNSIAAAGRSKRAVDAGTAIARPSPRRRSSGPAVAKFFDDVMVMADDPKLRDARLRLLKRLEGLILQLADVSEIVPESDKQE